MEDDSLNVRVLCDFTFAVFAVFAFARVFNYCSFLFHLFVFVLCPFLATMSVAGYFLARFLLFAFPAFFSPNVST